MNIKPTDCNFVNESGGGGMRARFQLCLEFHIYTRTSHLRTHWNYVFELNSHKIKRKYGYYGDSDKSKDEKKKQTKEEKQTNQEQADLKPWSLNVRFNRTERINANRQNHVTFQRLKNCSGAEIMRCGGGEGWWWQRKPFLSQCVCLTFRKLATSCPFLWHFTLFYLPS